MSGSLAMAFERVGEAIRFETPVWTLAVLPVVLLLVIQFRKIRSRGVVAISGLEYLRARVPAAVGHRRRVRIALWGVLVAGLAALWAGPILRSPEPIFVDAVQSIHKHFMVALDVSPSMNLAIERPPAESQDLAARERAARGLSSGDDGATRYEVARGAFYNFVDRFKDARIGLILFSTHPFIARWPTVETAARFSEVLDENIRRGNGSQLEAFAGLTNIQAALDRARDVFAKLNSVEGKAIILISDAEDQVENMGAAVQRVRDQGIRLYTIGVGIPESVVDALSGRFAGDPGFRIFRVDSPEDMNEAYQLIGELEESPALALNQREFVLDLGWLLALLSAGVAGIIFWVLEARFHQTLGARGHETPARRGDRGLSVS